jgi:CheY-like chemotaxis protein
LAKEHVPNLIFVDINLPGMNGLAAVKVLRAVPSLGQTRMFALSAAGLSDEVEKGLNAGFEDYLIKSVQLEQIAKLVEE